MYVATCTYISTSLDTSLNLKIKLLRNTTTTIFDQFKNRDIMVKVSQDFCHTFLRLAEDGSGDFRLQTEDGAQVNKQHVVDCLQISCSVHNDISTQSKSLEVATSTGPLL